MRSLIRSAFPFGVDHPEFTEAANGHEAVEAYRLRRHDIVLLDIKMPVLDGLGALKAIRAFDEDAFVVMISGELTVEARLEAIAAGAISVVSKPVTQLIACQITQLFRRRVRRPAAILAIDESPVITATLKQGLDILALPVRMYRAHDPADAWHAFRTIHFDLVFLDSQLCGTDSLTLVSQIKAARPGTHVVMFTDDCTVESVIRARERGADDYLLKSVDLVQLKRVWQRFLAAAKEDFPDGARIGGAEG